MGKHTWRFADPGAPVPVPLLDGAQRSVVEWANGPALVLAGPGTGKTSTIVAAALERIAEGCEPSSVLVLTFGRDAAAEMRQRLALRIGNGEPPRVSTFHGFALDLVMRLQEDSGPLRLLSGAEQERAVREVIDGTLQDANLRGAWPPDLSEALGTRGFAKEVRTAFAAARALGLAGDEVARIGRNAGEAAWASVGPVLDEYLDTQSQQQALDYAELLFRALQAVHDDRNAALLRGLRHVYVDEYQDTDRMQVALLKGLARYATSLVAVGDPDQSIYGFRGADVRNIRDFAEDFEAMARARGLEAPALLALAANHRFGPAIRDYCGGTFGGVVPVGLSGEAAERHRTPRCLREDGAVRSFMYDDPMAEAAWIASQIRAIAQHTEAPWDSFAVLTRSSSTIGPIERALRRAGIPCETDVRDSRLADEPSVMTLLRALEVVASPDLLISPLHAHELLLSPMCGVDPTELRAIGRVLRTDRTTPSDQAIATALASPHPVLELLDGVPGGDRFEELRALLRRVHARVAAGTTPHEALWLLWSETPWPSTLRRHALEGASAAAHRDLDAVCELFDLADRSVQRRQGHAGVSSFLYEMRAQEVPSETLAGRGFRGASVQLMTAHRAKGLEWDHVFVAGVTEGVWPNLRRRSAILDVDRLTREGLVEPRGRAALFDEERRLFYVACTRARRTLTVSGTAGEGDDPQPSRLLMHPVIGPLLAPGRPTTIDSVAGLVAELRRTATSADTDPSLRAAAIARLRTLLRSRDANGAELFPEADPTRWWGARPRTASSVPVDPASAPLSVRGSSLDLLSKCGLAWFLQQRAYAEGTRGSAVVFGSAIHALVDGVTRGELDATPEAMAERLREVWNEAGYDAAWQSHRDFEQALAAIGRFLHWQAARGDVRVASEVEFDRVVEILTPTGRTERLRMRGKIDRIEISGDGTVAVFDFKTSRSAATQAEVREHAQLRYYQYAVAEGLLDEPVRAEGVGHPLQPGGAELVYLRIDAGRGDTQNPKTIGQAPFVDGRGEWATDVLGAGLDLVRGEAFAAVAGKHCSLCSMLVVCPLQPEGRVETA
jgi:superfamily I DNA/RNA helicase/RecB family exonuclease